MAICYSNNKRLAFWPSLSFLENQGRGHGKEWILFLFLFLTVGWLLTAMLLEPLRFWGMRGAMLL